ncbi:hypothetical protein ACJMK2_043285 [Sinanodonta woodiana]|uniref:Sugar transporter SWEET1 n=1 Tax=Sinanodonta woodiana TaxID=1069815 RepID=A0ABD3VWG5_SINWO
MSVEVATELVTYLSVVSGIAPVLQMYKSGNTRNVPFLFFVIGELLASSCISYGLLTENLVILRINLVVLFFNTSYILIYLYVVRSKSAALRQIVFCLAVIVSILVYLRYFSTSKQQSIAVFGTILLIGSSVLNVTPALEVWECIKQKTAAGISIPMMFAYLICCGLWLTYGLSLKDFNIYAPNVIGLATHGSKALAILMYGRQSLPHTD